MSYPDPKQNPKNATNLLADVNIGRDANVARDVTVQNNVNLGEKIQPIDLVKDTVYIDGSFNAGGLLTVDYTSGLVQIANDLIVYGRLVVPEIDYTGIVTVGDNITLNGHDGSISSLTITAATGTLTTLVVTDQSYFRNTMNVQHQTGVFGTVIADRFIGPFDAPTGYIHDFTVDNLYVNSSATFTGPAVFNGSLLAQSGTFASLSATSLSAQSGSFASLSATGINAQTIVSQTIISQTGIFASLTSQSGTFSSLSATGIVAQSGTFSTVVATGVYASTVVATTGIFQNLVAPSLDVTNLTVRQNLYLGNEIAPIDPTVDDTLFIDATLNVANIFTADKETGLITVPNNLSVLGRLEVAEIGYTNLIQIGSQIKLDGVANTITAYNSDGTLTYTLDAQTGNTIAPTTTGWFGTVIADKFIGPISLNTGTISAPTGVFDNLSVKNLYVSDSATFTGPLVAQTITVQTVSAQSVSAQTLAASTGYITSLSATGANILSLNAASGTITNLYVSSGSIASLSVQTGTFASLVAQQLVASTGYITSLSATGANILSLNATSGTITNLSSTTLTAASGTITNLSSSYFTATSGSIASLSVQTGSVSTLNVSQLNVSSGAAFSGAFNVYTTLNAAGQTGVFGTVVADNIQLNNNLSVQSLTVQQDLYLGKEIKPLDSTIDDTLFVDATLNVANIFIADKETGLITVPNNMTIMGRLEVTEIGYTNVVEVGTQMLLDGINNQIVLTNADGTITSVQDAQTGNLIAKSATGWFGTVIADKFIGPISLNTGTLSALTGVFDNLSVKNLYVSDSATFTGPLVAQSISTQVLSASTGYIAALSATGANISSLSASSGTITNLSATTLTASSGSIASLSVQTGTFATLVAQQVIATTGFFTSLNATGATILALNAASGTITDLSATTLTSASGTITNLSSSYLTATSGSIASLSVQTGTVSTLNVSQLNVSSGAAFSGAFNMYTTLNAAGQTGVFGTVVADNVQLNNNLTVQSLTVQQDLYLGKEIKPLDPTIDDTLFVDATLNIANIFTADKETGLITVPNNLVVMGRLEVTEIGYTNVVQVGTQVVIDGINNQIVLTNADGTITSVQDAQTGNLIAKSATGWFGTVIADKFVGPIELNTGTLSALTGVFDNLSVKNLFVSNSATFTGPLVAQTISTQSITTQSITASTGSFVGLSATGANIASLAAQSVVASSGSFVGLSATGANITGLVAQSLTATSGSFVGLNATGANIALLSAQSGTFGGISVTSGAAFSGAFNVYTTLNAAGQTGVFGTIVTDNIELHNDLTVHNLTVTQDIALGNEIKPIDPAVSDTLFVEGSLNVANIFLADTETGLITIPNNLLVYGRLEVDEIGYTNVVQVGTQIALDGAAAQIVLTNAAGTITSVQDAETGNLIAKSATGWFGTIIADNFVGTGSFTQANINNLQVFQSATFTGPVVINNSLYANSGTINLLNSGTGFFDTVVANRYVGPISTYTGTFTSLTTADLYVTHSATFTGPVTAQGPVSVGLLNASTGFITSLTVTGTLNATQLNTTQLSSQSITSNSGIFAGISVTTITGGSATFDTIHINSETINNLTVYNDIALGNQLVPIDPDTNDTMFINANLNVANVFTIDQLTGEVVIPNNLTIMGRLDVKEIGYIGTLSVGTDILLDGINNQIVTLNDAGTITSTWNAQNGNFIAPTATGQFGTIIADRFVGVFSTTGAIDELTVMDLFVTKSATFTGPVLFNNLVTAQTISTQSITSSSGSFAQLYAASVTISTGSAQLLNVASLQAQTGTINSLTSLSISSASMSISTGSVGLLSVSSLQAQTGTITSLTSSYASISSLNVATGSAQLFNVASLQAQTGTIGVLTAPVLSSTTGTITNLSSASGTFVNLSASTITASTGIFTTFETTELIVDDNLVVMNNLVLGNSIVPLQPTIQDTMFVDSNFNVANVFTIDSVSGDTVCANDFTVAGNLNVVNINYAGVALFGSSIAIDGANGVQTFVDANSTQTISLDANSGTIKCNNISVPAYFSALFTGPTTIYQAGDALRGQTIVPSGQSAIRIYTSKVFTTSYANAVMMTPTSSEMVQCVTPYNGYLDITVTGTTGDRTISWMIFN